MKYSEQLLKMPFHIYFWIIMFRMKDDWVGQFVWKWGSGIYQMISTKRRDFTPFGFFVMILKP